MNTALETSTGARYLASIAHGNGRWASAHRLAVNEGHDRRFTAGTEGDFRAFLYAPETHDPDLIIHTSGGPKRLPVGRATASTQATKCYSTNRRCEGT